VTAAAGAGCLAVRDDDLCTATYPGRGRVFGMLCNSEQDHDDNHRALAEVAPGYRRHVVWAQAGHVLPDEETSPAGPARGQIPPGEGVRLT
jgi:hypothetical protein